MSVDMKWKSEDFDVYVEVRPLTDVKQHFAGDECWCNPITDNSEGRPLIIHNVFDNCNSYNMDIGETPEVILPRPSWMPEGERMNGVPVDACIADVVEYLWAKGIITLGSCCGHGKESPSLVLGEGEKDYAKIEKLIGDKDSRMWKLNQWQLVAVEVRK